MPHINVKPLERTRVYTEPGQAINHVLLNHVWSKNWDYDGASFGRTIGERRAIDAAIKANDPSKFAAFQRRGYWRVELA